MKKHENTWLPIICSIMFFALANGTLLGPVLPEMLAPLKTAEQDIGMVVAVFTLATALFTPVFGMFADRLSRKTLLIPCLVLNGFSGLACYFAQDFETLLIFRFVQGIGAAGMLLLALLLIGDLYPGHERVHATSRVGMTSAIGLVSFPVLGGLMALKSWNFPFLFYGLVLPLAVFASIFLPGGKGLEVPSEKRYGKKIDEKGTRLSGTKINGTKINGTKINGTKLKGTRLSGTKLKGTGINRKVNNGNEKNRKKSLSELFSTLRDFKVLYAIFLGFAIFFLLFVIVIYLPFKLKTDFGYTSKEAGFAQGIIGITVIFVSSRAKGLSLKYSLFSLTGAGFFLTALTCGMIGLVHSKVLLILLLMLFGVGGGLIQIMGDTLILQVAPIASMGSTVSLYNSMKYAGQTLSPVFFGFMLVRFGLKPVFLSGAGFGFVVAGMCWLLKGRLKAEHEYAHVEEHSKGKDSALTFKND
ncbi:TPA: MFS transporter [Methanosarcina acetivorans]|uniref:Transport protein n=2 Tax=Methanosarcina acetivorans TaxID=2214 RepID=Q8TQM4_METAC|nr:MFS transporter [Methanosarcina acetivorans]AAM04930.1 transport protein [Methanosarcina acetivorans C2A]HIH93153.1 MFS transporter [Methanosarcina acetivorans]